jgi:hypothetical protein
MSGELWLAEGFTNYYGPLVLKRAGLMNLRKFLDDMGGAIDEVVTSPGRKLRNAVEMSQMAPFVDRAATADRTNFDNTFISYYTWGSVIAMGTGPHAARSHRRARDARRLHAGVVAALRQARCSRAGVCRDAVHQ